MDELFGEKLVLWGNLKRLAKEVVILCVIIMQGLWKLFMWFGKMFFKFGEWINKKIEKKSQDLEV